MIILIIFVRVIVARRRYDIITYVIKQRLIIYIIIHLQ
ncbi:hypothetical protein SPLA5a_PHROGS00142 [Salmonella phage SPLA5a]|nr:hypothetical protein SPLA5a_PHROGS00142 [Salmonella phage SPLA5a]